MSTGANIYYIHRREVIDNTLHELLDEYWSHYMIKQRAVQYAEERLGVWMIVQCSTET